MTTEPVLLLMNEVMLPLTVNVVSDIVGFGAAIDVDDRGSCGVIDVVVVSVVVVVISGVVVVIDAVVVGVVVVIDVGILIVPIIKQFSSYRSCFTTPT